MECAPCEPAGEQPFAFVSKGPGTLKVPATLALAARKKLVAALAAAGAEDGAVLLRGGKSSTRNDTDHEHLFRQESYFAHLFAVVEPDCWGVIELPSGRTTLLVPRLDPSYAVWMGKIETPPSFRRRYHVDACAYADEVQATVAAALAAGGPVHVMRGVNSDSGLDISDVLPAADGVPAGARVVHDVLYEVAAECRVLKSAAEIELMRYSAYVSSRAHAAVMAEVKAGMMEYQLEASFTHHCAYYGGCRMPAYTCICACGPNSAVLHYGHAGAPNERRLERTDIALLDMGCEYFCYTSDITCSFPVSGTFSPDQRAVYETVLDAQTQILNAMRPGVPWPDLHRLMWRVTLEHLVGMGVLAGELDEMLGVHLGATFIPCGMGHLIGVDTHDVGGYLRHTPARIEQPGIAKLRTARTLQAGMVLTVEPGLYFIDALLEPALADPATAKFFVPGGVDKYRGFGGVRLEDVVVVTETGIDNLTLCPRTIPEVEGVMAGGEWPPKADGAPQLHRRWATLDKATGTMALGGVAV